MIRQRLRVFSGYLVKLWIVMAIALSLSGCFAGRAESNTGDARESLAAGDHEFSIRVNGADRHYSVHLPPDVGNARAMPVVVMLHGGGGTGKSAQRETGWSDKADREHFLAVFPDALPPNPNRRSSFALNPQLWNDGSERFYADQSVVDDVAFLDRMLDQLVTRFNVDTQRIYFTGFSNGASMSFYLASRLTTRIAAIAPVAGASWVSPPRSVPALSVLYITGTEDPLNPLAGGEPVLASGGSDKVRSKPKPPVRESIAQWLAALDCPSTPQRVTAPEGAHTEIFQPCREGAEVRYLRIEGLGHHWPGGRKMLPESMVGEWSDRVSATDLIWTFFSSH